MSQPKQFTKDGYPLTWGTTFFHLDYQEVVYIGPHPTGHNGGVCVVMHKNRTTAPNVMADSLFGDFGNYRAAAEAAQKEGGK